MNALDCLFVIAASIALLGIAGWITYLVGGRAGFKEGWGLARDDMKDRDIFNLKKLDRLHEECKAQRDSAHVALAEAHIEIGRLSREVARLSTFHSDHLGDIGQIWGAANTIMDRAATMELRVAAAAVVGGGQGGDGVAEVGEDVADVATAELANEVSPGEVGDDIDDDEDLDDEEDDFVCPDCGEDVEDCGCDLEDDDDEDDGFDEDGLDDEDDDLDDDSGDYCQECGEDLVYCECGYDDPEEDDE